MAKSAKSLMIPDELVMNTIYLNRGQKVMLDRELAELYGVETRILDQALRRNIERFPEDFMFEFSSEEWEFLRLQIVILKIGSEQQQKYMPLAFTEQGVAMRSGILNSETAGRVNIQIIRFFTKMRELVLTHKDILLHSNAIFLLIYLLLHHQHLESSRNHFWSFAGSSFFCISGG
jgi:ORF6N domain-containing protein